MGAGCGGTSGAGVLPHMDNEQVLAVNDAAAATEADAAPKKATRTRRKAAPKAGALIPETDVTGTGTPEGALAGVDAPEVSAPGTGPADSGAPEAKAPVRRTRARKKADTAEPLPAFAPEAGSPEAEAPEAESEAAEPEVVPGL